MGNKGENFELHGFHALLGSIAEDYNIRPADVLLLMQEHSLECSRYFRDGELYAETIRGKIDSEISKLEKEINSEEQGKNSQDT